MRRIVVVRYSEIGLKGKNRKDFEKALMRNIERSTGWKTEWRWGRIYVLVDWKHENVSMLKNIFGIQNYSPAYLIETSFENIKSVSESLVEDEIKSGAKTFKVSARRVSKDFKMGVYDINRELGAHILKNFADRISVDVHNPDFTLGVEIRSDETLVYTRKDRGPGGLPVGISGRAVLLLSGGIDSPVAGWYAMKRGVLISALSFTSPPYTDSKSKEKIIDIVKKLRDFSGGHELELYLCPLTPVLELIVDRTPRKFWLVLQRRSMMRIATKLAREIGAVAIYTGESVGQVASQTLWNIGVIEKATDLPVMRPLSGLDKVEIIDKAKEIGTYEISIRPQPDVCSIFSPKRPATRSKPESIEHLEREIESELNEAERRSLESVESFKV